MVLKMMRTLITRKFGNADVRISKIRTKALKKAYISLIIYREYVLAKIAEFKMR